MIKSAYIHIPFCSHKCDFCDFTAFSGLDDSAAPYCKTVCREIEDRLKGAAYAGELSTIYFGGGTPGLIEAALIEEILQTLREHTGISSGAEISLETTPDTITSERLQAWESIGINRLSIGVESLNDGELQAIGRGQNAETALQGLQAARQSGFENISCDLMYGLPTQTAGSWSCSVDRALSFGFPHLSAYGLSLAYNSPLWRRFPQTSAAYPNDDCTLKMYGALVRKCESAGLLQYEVSNFARPGFESKHNQVYWNNEEYLAFGVGAHRYVQGRRSCNTRSFAQYMRNRLSLEQDEPIDQETKLKEGVILGLRARSGIDLLSFERRYGVRLQEHFAAGINKLQDGGFLDLTGGRMKLTQKGVMVSNLVLSEFV